MLKGLLSRAKTQLGGSRTGANGSAKAPALQLILKQLDEINLPRILFINKVDKTDSSPRNVLEWLQPASSKPLILRQLPIMKSSIVTGFGLGVIEGLTKVFYPEASNTVIFVIMALVLLVKPAGLFGRAQ